MYILYIRVVGKNKKYVAIVQKMCNHWILVVIKICFILKLGVTFCSACIKQKGKNI